MAGAATRRNLAAVSLRSGSLGPLGTRCCVAVARRWRNGVTHLGGDRLVTLQNEFGDLKEFQQEKHGYMLFDNVNHWICVERASSVPSQQYSGQFPHRSLFVLSVVVSDTAGCNCRFVCGVELFGVGRPYV